ncbi:hypothetical protein JCM11491_001835 [Sporobolomyces phaffii]
MSSFSRPAPPQRPATNMTMTTTEAETEVVEDKFASAESDAARAAKQASEWNSLLQWNRQTRFAQAGGVQGGWDYATGQYHVPLLSPEHYSGLAIDPTAAPLPTRHPTSVTVSANGDKEFELSGDDGPGGSGAAGGSGGGGGANKGYHDSGRPKRSRQAMTRG